MGRRSLGADPGFSVRDDRIEKPDDVNALVEHAGGKLLRKGRIAEHDRNNRMGAGFDRQALFGQRRPEIICIGFELVSKLGRFGQHLERLDCGGDNRRRDTV